VRLRIPRFTVVIRLHALQFHPCPFFFLFPLSL
jgi:hypothetical protein